MEIALVQILLNFIVRVGSMKDYLTLNDKNNPYYFDFGSQTTICPKPNKCVDGKFNFLCAKEPMKPSPSCKRFVPIVTTPQSRSRMVHVHNGLRNNVAYNERLSNMNLVYWNVHLQNMAEQYLLLCQPYRDTCLIVGRDGYLVGHNSLFVSSSHVEVLNMWEGRTVRHWFLEMGSDCITKNIAGDISNLTQLLWPSLQFVGCSAAIMFDGFFIVCYYYPAINQSLKSQLTYLRKNESCVCPTNRLMCSLLFTSLCGIDLELGSATVIEARTLLFVFMSFVLMQFL